MTGPGSTRSPAVAGRFYPASPMSLAAMVGRLLDGVSLAASKEPLAAAYVVPHAGYQYSGATAAQVYARLREHKATIDRVVLLGPAHFVAAKGCVVPASDWWQTPLGSVPIDRGCADLLARSGHASLDDEVHGPEHSLEVQLPFLQVVLDAGVTVLPVAVGPAPANGVAALVVAALGCADDPGRSVVICSTDLSHYLPVEAAHRADQQTIEAIVDRDMDRIGAASACGSHALRGVLAWAVRQHQRPRLLHYTTSAESTGDRSRVVGYAALAFDP